ncbi:hypothetical protein F4818DRAFT_410503 [Hypoxylon cercidicola]|nr:hypothetical protein F4818DRAFT_410503 [Hypoxylon cercidicola]
MTKSLMLMPTLTTYVSLLPILSGKKSFQIAVVPDWNRTRWNSQAAYLYASHPRRGHSGAQPPLVGVSEGEGI